MSSHVLKTLVTLTLLSIAASQGCGATRKTHTSGLRTPIPPSATQLCNQLGKSCCSIVTEFNMKNTAKDFSKTIFMNAKSLALDGMLPECLPQDCVDLIEQRIKGEEVSYEQLTTTALGYYIKESCLEQEGIQQLVRKSTPYVKSVADKYYALSLGSKAIVEGLSTLPDFELSNECQNALIKNGVPANGMLKNEYCQVCSKATIKEKTCKSLCVNTVNACINELTGVSEVLNELVNDMDVLYANLMTEYFSFDGAMAMFESTVRSQFLDANVDCDTGNSGFEPILDLTINQEFYSVTKKLGKYFENAIKFPCALSVNKVSKCWTGVGMVESYLVSDYPIYDFSTEQQLMNPVLARATPRSDVVLLESSLSDAANAASDALEGFDLFVVPEYVEPEVIEEILEQEVDKSGDGVVLEEEDKKQGDVGEKDEEKEGNKTDMDEDKSGGEETNEVSGGTGKTEDKKEEMKVDIKKENISDLDITVEEGASTNVKDSSAVSSSLSIIISALSLLICVVGA